jgi:hypothetical protein
MITLCTRSCIDRDGVGDGDIPGYANNRHRHVINAKLLLELSVTEAEAVLVMKQAIPLNANCLIKTDHFWTAR